MSNILTLTGPSQAGKSTAINYFLKANYSNYSPVCLPKFTTRPPRGDDSPQEVICCKSLPKNCDLVYQQYDFRYGLNSDDIISNLKQNKTVILILNDVRTIYEVKRMFGDICYSIFLFREAPNRDKFIEISKARGGTSIEQINKRLKKAEAIYRIYIENIQLFDKVIINSFEKKELKIQVKNIIKLVSNINSLYLKQ